MKQISLIVLVSGFMGLSFSCKSRDNHMKNVTAITEVFGDGQKTTTAVVEYDANIKNSSLSSQDFSVEGRTVVKVYANDSAAKSAEGRDGNYVIIELSPTDASAATFLQQSFQSALNKAKVSVKQIGDIQTQQGRTYELSGKAVTNDKQINLVVDDFKQFTYKDTKTGKTIHYNLFIPKQYDKNKVYPMVMFIHDAGVTSSDVKTTLVQGLGAVVWATPSEQAKHECFVLAPQFDKDSNPADESSEGSMLRDAIVNLITDLTNTYSIDKNRLYTTGQSMGCMTSIALNIKYPNLFAASYLVAGQWDASVVSPMVNDNLWIVVSQGDLRAYPGMNAITDTLQKDGATISRAVWSGKSTPTEFSDSVQAMMRDKANIRYVALLKGTVVPQNMRDDGGSNHICTWRIAYTVEGIRDWLFAQTK